MVGRGDGGLVRWCARCECRRASGHRGRRGGRRSWARPEPLARQLGAAVRTRRARAPWRCGAGEGSRRHSVLRRRFRARAASRARPGVQCRGAHRHPWLRIDLADAAHGRPVRQPAGGCGGPRHRHGAGRNGTRRAYRGPAAAREPSTGDHGRPDRSGQPPSPAGPPRRVDRGGGGPRRGAGAPAGRSRRLQGAQRHARPPCRRRGPAPDRSAHVGVAAPRGHARPPRWRRVRARARAG